MLRKIIHTKQEPVLTLELPENLRGRRIEVIAFEIEDDSPTTATRNTDNFDEDIKNWHSVEESEAIVLEAVKNTMPIVIDPVVTEKLRQLVIILVDENYFATDEAAEKYVQAIYKFIRTIPSLAYRKTKEITLDIFYVSYKANRRTTWYILFDIKNENYFIRNVFNNHSPDYSAFIQNLS